MSELGDGYDLNDRPSLGLVGEVETLAGDRLTIPGGAIIRAHD